ncbi:zinc finger protein 79 [Gouania willdenowi]|uniref:zinc finger protein 79 n=1 Tax=Gouania willdenowi TaxID=441366 RepID=UPI0010565817|nr:zinc finger protein 79-like [Gouania willdenowi]
MAEGTFQSQLSCVMETVFKAAMYEITRLVEDSFMEEVKRSRRQVESLRERLRTRDMELKGRCADCSRTALSAPGHTDRNLKQESDFRSESDAQREEEEEQSHNDDDDADQTQFQSVHQEKFDGLLKEQSLQICSKTDQSQAWSFSFDDPDVSTVVDSEHHTLKSQLSWTASFEPGADVAKVAATQRSDSSYGLDPHLSAACQSSSSRNMLSHCEGVLSYHEEKRDVSMDAIIHASGELSCLLINEDGFLQKPNLSYTLANRLASNISTEHCDPTLRGSELRPPHSCTHCGKTFSQASQLGLHLRLHSSQGPPSKRNQGGQKPYCCAVCGNKFSRLWNLKLHRRIHTQEKPHRCSMCEKSFTRADILKVHQRTHTGERPYRCTACSLSFKRLDHLKTHQRKHTTAYLP